MDMFSKSAGIYDIAGSIFVIDPEKKTVTYLDHGKWVTHEFSSTDFSIALELITEIGTPV